MRGLEKSIISNVSSGENAIELVARGDFSRCHVSSKGKVARYYGTVYIIRLDRATAGVFECTKSSESDTSQVEYWKEEARDAFECVIKKFLNISYDAWIDITPNTPEFFTVICEQLIEPKETTTEVIKANCSTQIVKRPATVKETVRDCSETRVRIIGVNKDNEDFTEKYFDGLMNEIPEGLLKAEVIDVGYSFRSQVPIISITAGSAEL